MARTMGRLKALKVSQTKKPGMYADGGGLYLQVVSPAAKSWVFRYAVTGRERYMGLGSVNTISLQEARDAALACRKLRHAGVDPIEHRDAERARARVDAARVMTFDECAAAYIAAHEPSWNNPKHRQQWRNTLKDYASPVFADCRCRRSTPDL